MEQATPPPIAQSNCEWCTKPMDAAAIRCPSCGKLRKDIYNDKIKCYSFCVLGGALVGIGISMSRHRNDLYNTSSNGSTGTILIVAGVIAVIVGLFFYNKVSQRLKTYWWS